MSNLVGKAIWSAAVICVAVFGGWAKSEQWSVGKTSIATAIPTAIGTLAILWPLL